MKRPLAYKTVMVTGAASGIGRATAIEIARQGGWVVIADRVHEGALETLSLVQQQGEGSVIALDVTDDSQWAAAIAEVRATRGALHGLVNNAGASRLRPITELEADELSFLLAVNYAAPYFGICAALPLLRESGGGSIVNIASVAGLRAAPANSAYGGTKAAMIGLTRSFARALAGEAPRIRINAIAPGLIWSDSVARKMGEDGARRFREGVEPRTPIGRVGVPGEMATMIAYLLSDAASAVHGQVMAVSGGLEINFP